MMYTINSIAAICLILVIQLGVSLSQSPLKYSLLEEIEPGFVLGNINNYVMSNFYDIDHYQASLLHDYFEISKKNIIVKKRIDLEKFCNDASLCCGVNQCIVQLSVLIDTKNTIKNRLNVEIEVLDINDNKPTFKNDLQTVYFPENAKIGSMISLEGGLDNDFSQINQIQSYKFDEPTKTFMLDSNDMANLNLVLQKNIDYEKQNVYPARLAACDNATRCEYQKVIINIQDENDNFPIFEKRRYEVIIPESFEINKVVLSAKAHDLDGSQFNKTKYGFNDYRDSNLLSKFKINGRNGDIILKSKLSALQRSSYSFKIYAMDGGQVMTGKKDIVDVVINVEDINDNKPLIEVYESSINNKVKETFEMKIKENERPQKIMSLKVTDADLGLNAKVTCELKSPGSTLEQRFFEPDAYEINSIRSFDYEQESEIKAIFECRDSGSPPLSSYKSIKITVEDVNEYQPEFVQSDYHSSIKENFGPGNVVLTVRATDKDGAAILKYAIDESVTPYFAINPNTGVIKTASTPFDRELISSKSFRVTVTDDIVNPKSAETTVHINILDENDNDPIFKVSSLQFSITENQPVNSKLRGQLSASDNDKDMSNSYVSFSLIETYDSELKKCERNYFRIKVNGEIETLVVLDREVNDNFTLTVEAKDNGIPPRFTRVNATVTIHDVNDNSPQWIYPRPLDNRRNNINNLPMLNLTESTERFLLIMKLKAHDPDQNEAGRVSYILVNHHESLFSLNDSTGELRTEKSPLPHGEYKLQLRATDHGNPSRNSDSYILININDSGKLANINLTIIIGMVGITALISIFLIVAIICVRRRPRFHQSYLGPSTDVNKEQGNQYFTHNQWMYHPSDENAMPPLSDNESCIYVPSNFYEQQDPLIMHSLTVSRPASRLDYPLVLPSSHQTGNSDNKFVSPSSQNIERTSGTLRNNSGQYFSMNSPSGIIINGQELDGDSADSGKGASEVDLRLQHHLSNASRNYPTMPFPHHSTTTSTFGYQTSIPVSQYYSVNTNPRSFDSRFLTVHPSNLPGTRRLMSPTFNSNNQCQCFILPEDDVIQMNSDKDQLPMTTFSPKSMCNLKSSNYDDNCMYNDDIHSAVRPEYYSNCPYIQGATTGMSPLSFHTKDSLVNDHETVGENINDEKREAYISIFENNKMNNFLNSEQSNEENSIYTLGLSN